MKNLNRILVCPYTGEQPFLMSNLNDAAGFVATEEYYAVALGTMQFVEVESTNRDGTVTGCLGDYVPEYDMG